MYSSFNDRNSIIPNNVKNFDEDDRDAFIDLPVYGPHFEPSLIETENDDVFLD